MAMTSRGRIQKLLEDDLEELKRLFRAGYELGVVWIPKSSSNLSGEVRSKTILIYEKNLDEARETLLHEFLDYLLADILKPYRNLLNLFIKTINEEVYRKKETFIESLLKLIKPDVFRKNKENTT